MRKQEVVCATKRPNVHKVSKGSDSRSENDLAHKRPLDRNRNSETMKAPSSGNGDRACPKERQSTHIVLVVMMEGMASVRSQPFETLNLLSPPLLLLFKTKDKASFCILLDWWGSSLTCTVWDNVYMKPTDPSFIALFPHSSSL
ncbi:hypothetical protein TNCV_3600421 [Trichonephila clavipes]|nr:hypothetical protein TNCV_3600421 [Trichonephila clavipes]